MRTKRFLRIMVAGAVIAAGPAAALDVDSSRRTLVVEFDEMKAISWVQLHAGTCHEGDCPALGSATPVSFYFGVEGKKRLPLRMKLFYEGSSWVFAERMTFLVDGRRFVQSIPHQAWNRDTVSSGVWERADVAVSTLNPGLQRALCAAKSVKVRFEGDHEVHDQVLEDWQVEALRIECAAWREPLRKVEKLQEMVQRLNEAKEQQVHQRELEREREVAAHDAKVEPLQAAFKAACSAHQSCLESNSADECARATLPAFKGSCETAEKEGVSPFACRFPENQACIW